MIALPENRLKQIALFSLVAAACVLAAQITWLRDLGLVEASPFLIGCFGLAPLVACAAWLLLWRLSLTAKSRAGIAKRAGLAAFWVTAVALTIFWSLFYGTFMLGAGAA